MLVTCLKDDLQKALIVSERHTIKEDTNPLLKGVFVDVKSNTIAIRATNLDTGFEVLLPAQVKKQGSFVIPAKTSSSLLSSFLGDKVQLELKNNNVIITNSSTSTILKTLPLEDFPNFPKIKKTKTISLSSDILIKNLTPVIIAASTSNSRPEISSIFFNIKKNNIKFAATDSFRLAEKTINFTYDSFTSFLLPYTHIIELIKILEMYPSYINIYFDSTQVLFEGESFSYLTRVREAQFPNYEQIIPTSFSTEVIVMKNEFLSAIRRASIFSGRLKEVVFHIYPEDNIIEVTTKNTDIGEHVSQLKSKVTGDRMSIHFNYHYILDGVSQIQSDDVILRFNGDSKPVLIQNPFDASYIYLAMPMKNI